MIKVRVVLYLNKTIKKPNSWSNLTQSTKSSHTHNLLRSIHQPMIPNRIPQSNPRTQNGCRLHQIHPLRNPHHEMFMSHIRPRVSRPCVLTPFHRSGKDDWRLMVCLVGMLSKARSAMVSACKNEWWVGIFTAINVCRIRTWKVLLRSADWIPTNSCQSLCNVWVSSCLISHHPAVIVGFLGLGLMVDNRRACRDTPISLKSCFLMMREQTLITQYP